MITVWNPPLFAAGLLVVRNTYETIDHGKKWYFILEVLWNGQALELLSEAINKSREEDGSTEHLTITPLEGGYLFEYSAHLVSDDDVTEIQWAATLTRYMEETPTMPYLGMWQVDESRNTRTSTADERNRRQLAKQAVKDTIMACVSFAFILSIIGAICYLCLIH